MDSSLSRSGSSELPEPAAVSREGKPFLPRLERVARKVEYPLGCKDAGQEIDQAAPPETLDASPGLVVGGEGREGPEQQGPNFGPVVIERVVQELKESQMIDVQSPRHLDRA